MPIAASTDSRARERVTRGTRRERRVALGELDARLCHGERVAQLVRDEAREPRQPATLVLLLADVAQEEHRAATRDRRALDVDEHVASRTSGPAA